MAQSSSRPTHPIRPLVRARASVPQPSALAALAVKSPIAHMSGFHAPTQQFHVPMLDHATSLSCHNCKVEIGQAQPHFLGSLVTKVGEPIIDRISLLICNSSVSGEICFLHRKIVIVKNEKFSYLCIEY